MGGAQSKNEYKLPICLISKNGDGSLRQTERETEFFELWSTLVKEAKKFCQENKKNINRYDLEEAHLSKIGRCLYVKKDENGQKVDGVAPFLYPKIKMNGKTGEVYTKFKKGKIRRGEEATLQLKNIEGKRCHIRANVHFESIFVNPQYVSIQVKVLEAAIYPIQKEVEYVIPVEIEDE